MTRPQLDQLGRLALHGAPTAELAAYALEIAMAHDLTAYDAAYVALSQQLGLPLITADAPLVSALARTPFDVHWLGTHPIPRCTLLSR
jgi:predicted nucleic acid-binding protein